MSNLLSLVPWFVTSVSAFPMTLVGALIVASHRQYRKSSVAVLFGSFWILAGFFLIGAFSVNHFTLPFSNVLSVMLYIIALAIAVGLSSFYLMTIYSNSTYIWLKRGERGVSQLLKLLGQGSLFVRRDQAVRILGKIADVRIVDPLIDALADKEVWVRAEAARALGNLGDERALPFLEKMVVEDTGLDTDHRPIKDIASTAIERIRAHSR